MLKQYLSHPLTSGLFHCPGVDIVLDGTQLPIGDQLLRGIVMTDVLHHIPDVRRFFAQASRCIQPGGVIVMWDVRSDRVREKSKPLTGARIEGADLP